MPLSTPQVTCVVVSLHIPQGMPLADACSAAGVRAFPTWVINGRTVEGELTFEQLEAELANKDGSAAVLAS